MERELWLSRDNTAGGSYNITEGEPTGYRSGTCYDFLVAFEPEDFHRLFPGQSLRKGRKKRIKRILIELEN